MRASKFLIGGLLLLLLNSNFAFASVDDICFAPEGPCEQKIVDFVNSAQKSVDMAAYSMTLFSMKRALIGLHQKGIAVRVVMDRVQASADYAKPLVQELQAAGVPVRFWNSKAPNADMHMKATVVDGARVETGSFNYTKKAANMNAENQIYISDTAVAKKYLDEIDLLWKASDEKL
jgi:phosphatidylserine/phosphatidylglycerophosphate/cardiolipin synthase-like enzyme